MKVKIFKQPEIKELALRFTRYAWGKLVYVNELSTTEISGFCISNPNDLLLVEDIAFLQQVNTGASTLLDDEAVADHFDDQVDAGRKPNQFARIWLHTHPNHFSKRTQRNRNIVVNNDFLVPSPSGTDENTIRRVFGTCDWAVMFIYSGGSTGYARLVIKKPVDGQIVLPVIMQRKGKSPTKKDFARWQQEFRTNITEKVFSIPAAQGFDNLLPTQYLQLIDVIDTDIDIEEFGRFIELGGETVGSFCQFDESRRQRWMSEFRRSKELSAQHIIRNQNPYF